MGKKVREYKSGDFIFAKVKGYPAWPARVQRMNGKKYFVYFYGTGETANLPPNMIFDYAENKDKFLTKTVKRRDFNDGVKQIEHDFANNVPLEDVIGVPMEVGEAPAVDTTANDSAIETTLNDTLEDTAADINETADDTLNTSQSEPAVEDSDDAGPLVIDEGKAPAKGRKSKVEPKTPIKPKEVKTPRGKGKKEEIKEKEKEDPKESEKKDEEVVSRSGRKIRPKRYIDEQADESTTLPSPAPKKRRGASPLPDKDKNIKHFNAVTQSELEDLKEPFKPEDAEKDNILITYLPSGRYIGIKLFQSRPNSFKDEAARLQWDKQAASNAVTLKMQLERGQITAQSIQGQLVMDLNLTDEEKATLDKERETEEKKSRVHFLKTEMKLIELDAKIKTCLCLEKADTEMCLKLLDELMELEVKPLMLLKHPTCLETVKRMRAYVGNTPSWDLSETDALSFSKQAHRIRKQADILYKNMKELFVTPEGLSFWEFFSERVLQFKKVTAKLSAGELLEMVHEPLELSQPSSVTMKAAIEAAQEEQLEDEAPTKKNKTPVKSKKPAANSTPKGKRTRKQAEKEEKSNKQDEGDKAKETNEETVEKPEENNTAEKMDEEKDEEQPETTTKDNEEIGNGDASKQNDDKCDEKQTNDSDKQNDEQTEDKTDDNEEEVMEDAAKESDAQAKDTEKAKDNKSKEKPAKEDKSKTDKATKDSDKPTKEPKTNDKSKDDKPKDNEKSSKDSEKSTKDSEKNAKDKSNDKDADKNSKGDEKDKKSEANEKVEEKDRDVGEPRAKRTRENKKTEPPPPRSPAKRKAKV